MTKHAMIAAKGAGIPVEDGGRRQVIVEAAVLQFAEHGYDATTMRDIAALTGILPGSIYHYFASKEELFAAAHSRAFDVMHAAVHGAIDPLAEPWIRLEQAMAGYLDVMLESGAMYARVINTEFPRRRTTGLRERLIADRRRVEQIFVKIVESLPLQEGVDRRYWRLSLMGIIAWTHIWYHPNGDPPAVMAKNFLKLMKERTAA